MRYFLGMVIVFFMVPLSASADIRVNVVGLFSGKALLVINGAAPRTLAVGQTSPEGVKLLSADSTQAVLEIEGRRKELGMGQGASVAGVTAATAATAPGMTLYANHDGHFIGEGSINGKSVKFIVDTGATTVAMNSAEARRLGIDYVSGREGASSTAGGLVKAWGVTLNSIKLGSMTLNQVDAVVIDGDAPPIVLMGMSALNRLDMKRDGMTMTLMKKY